MKISILGGQIDIPAGQHSVVAPVGVAHGADTMDEPVTSQLDTMCECDHRARFHEGRKRLCVMASCNCTGFVAKAEEVEAQSG